MKLFPILYLPNPSNPKFLSTFYVMWPESSNHLKSKHSQQWTFTKSFLNLNCSHFMNISFHFLVHYNVKF